jgi:hypothetical protein
MGGEGQGVSKARGQQGEPAKAAAARRRREPRQQANSPEHRDERSSTQMWSGTKGGEREFMQPP